MTIQWPWTTQKSAISHSTVGWEELADHIQGNIPPTPVVHQAWAVTEWPQGSVGERLTLAAGPLRSNTWPLVQWVWRCLPSPLLLNGSLTRKIRRLEMAVAELGQQETGPRRDEWVGLEGLKAMRDALVFQGESLVETDALVVVTSTPELLVEDTMLLQARWQSLGIRTRAITHEQYAAILRAWGTGAAPFSPGLSGLSWAQKLRRWIAGNTESPIWEPRVMTADRAASLAWPGWGTTGESQNQGVYIGHTSQGQPVFVDFFRSEAENAANLLTVGNTGTGKSFWMKTLIRGLLAAGFYVTILDVDGEYQALCQAEHGTWIDISGRQSSALPDPFAIPQAIGAPAIDAQRWGRMLGTAGQLLRILGDLDQEGVAAVEQAVIAVWHQLGVDAKHPASWDHLPTDPKPTIAAVWQTLSDRTDDPSAQTAARRLWTYVHGSKQYLFAGDALVWDAPPTPLTVWHLGNLAQQRETDQNQLPPETAGRYALVFHTIWEWLRLRRQDHQWTAVVVDEGQRVLYQPILGSSVVDLASTIRKWNGILYFATNTPDPLWTTPAGAGLWDTTPLKAFLKMERSRAEAAAKALNMPSTVTDGIIRMPEHTVMARLWRDEWVTVRAEVPPEEERLYKTRG